MTWAVPWGSCSAVWPPNGEYGVDRAAVDRAAVDRDVVDRAAQQSHLAGRDRGPVAVPGVGEHLCLHVDAGDLGAPAATARPGPNPISRMCRPGRGSRSATARSFTAAVSVIQSRPIRRPSNPWGAAWAEGPAERSGSGGELSHGNSWCVEARAYPAVPGVTSPSAKSAASAVSGAEVWNWTGLRPSAGARPTARRSPAGSGRRCRPGDRCAAGRGYPGRSGRRQIGRRAGPGRRRTRAEPARRVPGRTGRPA